MRRFKCLVLCCLTGGLLMPTVANAKVNQNQRDLVIVTHLDLSDDDGKNKKFWDAVYTFIESSGVRMTKRHLKKHYREVHVIQTKPKDKTKKATKGHVIDLLKTVTQRKKTKAVDMVWMTHGLTNGRISLQSKTKNGNQRMTVKNLAREIKAAIGKPGEQKLRALFSTACYGKSAIDGWLAAGFKVVSGSRAVYTDSAASHPKFLKSWKKGKSFEKSVETANKGQHKFDFWDKQTAKLKRMKGYEIDSHREVKGARCLTINSDPNKVCKT